MPKLIDQVALNKKKFVITKKGKPMEELVALVDTKGDLMFGSLKHKASINGDIISPIDVEWEANR